MSFPRFIYFLPITLILHACGGGSEELTPEELSQYPEYPVQSILEQHNELTGRKGINPPNCTVNPKLCT
jgi:hypothetical protein